MSASTKKKLRQEQNAANAAKKQQTAKKESDKMKLYTIIFIAVIVFMIAVVAIAVVDKSGIVEKNTTAAKVGDAEISAVELNVFYVESINNFYTQYGNYLSIFGLDVYTPLNQQTSTDGSTSWADYFTKLALENAHSSYALYNAAMEAGYTLNEEYQASLENNIAAIKTAAEEAGFSNVDKYLTAYYGAGTTMEAVSHVMEVMCYASAYQLDYQNSLTYTADEIAAKDAADPNAYTYFNYNTYVMNASTYLEGGTEDEEGNITYSDEENTAALAAAKADAEALVAAKPTTTEDLDALIAELPINEGKTVSCLVTEDMNITSAPDFMQEWIADENRQVGDMEIFERTTTNDDGTTEITGYNVVLFQGSNRNEFALANVRHILIQPSGGTYDSSTGLTTYSDAEYAIAQKEAQAILDEWSAGDATEESFAALANEHSADSDGTDGGLYTDVYYNEMVESFNDWCFDESRQPGDTGLVKSEYGYHVMYYVGDSEMTHREHLVTQALLSEEATAWYENLLEVNAVESRNLSRINGSISLANYIAG